ncbi:MAG TPA: hypothetical protein VE287_12115, partial [Actinopolymorphaceae bacterium]|nr:hypothetical protein [Actinopolymorphaceae bacterium]
LVVHVAGESVIADPGRGRYTKAYFGPARYDHIVNSSLGHAVPVPNGQAQLPGQDHRAILLDHLVAGVDSAGGGRGAGGGGAGGGGAGAGERAGEDGDGAGGGGTDGSDLLRLDLAGAYPAEAGLESLVRTVVLHRDTPGGWVELTDEPTFAAPGEFETVLVTLGSAQVDGSSVLLRQGRGALRVGFDPAVVSARVETVKDVDFPHGTADLRRVVFASPGPVLSASVRLRIEPVDTHS